MTTSSNDGESLNAIRAANSMLKAAGKRWDNLILEPGNISAEPASPPATHHSYTTTDSQTIYPDNSKKQAPYGTGNYSEEEYVRAKQQAYCNSMMGSAQTNAYSPYVKNQGADLSSIFGDLFSGKII